MCAVGRWLSIFPVYPRRELNSLFRYSNQCPTGNCANKYDNNIVMGQERLTQRFVTLCSALAGSFATPGQ